MKKEGNGFTINRRDALRYGIAGIATLAAPGWLGALADTIDDAEKTGVGPTVKLDKKAGPYRIGFSKRLLRQ